MTDQEIGDTIERDAAALQLGHIELEDVVEPVPDFEMHLRTLLAGTQGAWFREQLRMAARTI